MSKIKNYDPDLNIQPEDKVIGTDANNSSRTKNYTFSQILNFLEYMGFGAVDGDLSHKEDNSNKVSDFTGLDDDEIKYPNTKAVADRVYSAIAESNGYTDIKVSTKADLVSGKVPQAQSQPSSLMYNPVNGMMTFTDATGAVQAIDLPIENLFQSAGYNSSTQILTLTTNGGAEVDIDLNDLVDLPEIVVAVSNPAVVPSSGQRLYLRSDTGALWIANAGAWNGPYLTVTTAEKATWNAKADDSNVLHKTGNEIKTSGTLQINDSLLLPALATSGKITSIGIDGLGNVTNIPNYDISITSPIDEDLLNYESSTGLWKNKALKKTTMSGNESSNVFLLTAKAIYDWAVGLFAPLTRLLNINGKSQDLSANREWRVAQGDTGVLTFGTGLTPNSSTTINIAPITGVVVNNESNPSIPSHVYINYTGETNKTVTTLGSGTGTYVMLGPDGSGGGTISFQNTFPTSAERKTKIWIGKLGHPSGAITTVVNEPDYILSPQSFARDLFQALGPYINDNVYAYPNGANLSVNITAGNIHGNGINLHNSNTVPNEIAVSGIAPMTFLYRTRTGEGGGGVTLIDPTQYDNAGTITPIGGAAGRSTIQYIFIIPGQGFIVQYGQTVYSTFAEAIAAADKENPVVFPNLIGNSLLLGVIALNRSATNLNDTTQARFFRADKLGQLIGAQAGTSTGTLQSAYDNSATPEIVTNSTLGAVTVQRGSSSDIDNIHEGKNGAGTTTWSVDGNGKQTATSIVKSGATATDALMGTGVTTILESGTYIPTVVGVLNTTPTGAFTSSYLRIGNIVKVTTSVNTEVTTASSNCVVSVTLPFAVTTGTLVNIGSGTVINTNSTTSQVVAWVQSGTSTTANINFVPTINTDDFNCMVTFQYSIT